MKRLAFLAPIVFLLILGLLLWHPWRTDEGTPPTGADPAAAEAPAAPEPEPFVPDIPEYEIAEPSKGGIGKIYLGREISQVMGHRGIKWLERDNREEEESPSSAIDALQLPPETVIADIGAGSGYYSFRIAKLIPEGEVVAVDIQPEMISHLEMTAAEKNITNVRPHLGTIEDVALEPESIDAAIMVDAYHEFSHPAEMMLSIREALRPGGQVFLLEFRAEDESVPISRLHKMSEEQVRKEMEAVGLEFVVNHDFLPWQHFLVFRKP